MTKVWAEIKHCLRKGDDHKTNDGHKRICHCLGLEWSRRALKKDDSSPNHFLRSRCNVYLGIGNMLKVRTVENSNERSEMLTKAFENFSAARTSDLNDHLPHYHLAFFYAITRYTFQSDKNPVHSNDSLSLTIGTCLVPCRTSR